MACGMSLHILNLITMKTVELKTIEKDTARILKATLNFFNESLSAVEGHHLSPYIQKQVVVQQWLRENFNLNIVPVRVANPFDNHVNHILYLNGREYYGNGIKIVDHSYEECLERGIRHMLAKILEEGIKPVVNERAATG